MSGALVQSPVPADVTHQDQGSLYYKKYRKLVRKNLSSENVSIMMYNVYNCFTEKSGFHYLLTFIDLDSYIDI